VALMTEELTAGAALAGHDVLYIPDEAANASSVICAAAEHV
jgi:glutamate dehydrogenase/leucine dehydrogenase